MFAFLMLPVTLFTPFVDMEMLVESFVLLPTFFRPGADIRMLAQRQVDSFRCRQMSKLLSPVRTSVRRKIGSIWSLAQLLRLWVPHLRREHAPSAAFVARHISMWAIAKIGCFHDDFCRLSSPRCRRPALAPPASWWCCCMSRYSSDYTLLHLCDV